MWIANKSLRVHPAGFFVSVARPFIQQWHCLIQGWPMGSISTLREKEGRHA
jgi:hypothetical protein